MRCESKAGTTKNTSFVRGKYDVTVRRIYVERRFFPCRVTCHLERAK